MSSFTSRHNIKSAKVCPFISKLYFVRIHNGIFRILDFVVQAYLHIMDFYFRRKYNPSVTLHWVLFSGDPSPQLNCRFRAQFLESLISALLLDKSALYLTNKTKGLLLVSCHVWVPCFFLYSYYQIKMIMAINTHQNILLTCRSSLSPLSAAIRNPFFFGNKLRI